MARLMVKPRVGDLVKFDDEAIKRTAYNGSFVGDVGVIIECIGIRCRVFWAGAPDYHGNNTSLPERDVLEVVHACR